MPSLASVGLAVVTFAFAACAPTVSLRSSYVTLPFGSFIQSLGVREYRRDDLLALSAQVVDVAEPEVELRHRVR